MTLYRIRYLLVCLALGVVPSSAGLAHSVGRSALTLDFERGEGRASWRIGVRDLDALLGAGHTAQVTFERDGQSASEVLTADARRLELRIGADDSW